MIGRDEICNAIGHKWEPTYYGTKCMNCGLFYPDGCAPWDMMPDDFDDDELDFMPGDEEE